MSDSIIKKRPPVPSYWDKAPQEGLCLAGPKLRFILIGFLISLLVFLNPISICRVLNCLTLVSFTLSALTMQPGAQEQGDY